MKYHTLSSTCLLAKLEARDYLIHPRRGKFFETVSNITEVSTHVPHQACNPILKGFHESTPVVCVCARAQIKSNVQNTGVAWNSVSRGFWLAGWLPWRASVYIKRVLAGWLPWRASVILIYKIKRVFARYVEGKDAVEYVRSSIGAALPVRVQGRILDKLYIIN